MAFHRGMGRFYRKFYAPRRSPLTSVAVYLGIGLKLLASLVARLGDGVSALPPVRRVNACQAGFGSRPDVNRPVWSNQMPPGTSRHEYQMTPGILYRLRFLAASAVGLAQIRGLPLAGRRSGPCGDRRWPSRPR